jgi:hypothetical protein
MPAMRRSVTFRSDRFESRTPGPHFINPGNFGEDLAVWLRGRLPERLAPGEPIQEDYGWGVWVRSGEDPYWIAAGKMEEDEDAEPAPLPTWLITVAYDPGLNLLRRLMHRPRRADLDAVCAAIHDALRDEAGISEVQWWPEEPFRGPASSHP